MITRLRSYSLCILVHHWIHLISAHQLNSITEVSGFIEYFTYILILISEISRGMFNTGARKKKNNPLSGIIFNTSFDWHGVLKYRSLRVLIVHFIAKIWHFQVLKLHVCYHTTSIQTEGRQCSNRWLWDTSFFSNSLKQNVCYYYITNNNIIIKMLFLRTKKAQRRLIDFFLKKSEAKCVLLFNYIINNVPYGLCLCFDK